MKDTRRTRLVLGGLLIVSFVLITVDARGGASGQSPLAGLRRIGASLFGPVERVTSSAVRPMGNFFGGLGHSSSDTARISQLQAEVASLQTQVRDSSFDHNRATELAKLTHVASVGQLTLRDAQVIAIGAGQNFSWTLTINVGSHDGVTPGMTVLDGDGLVGRTVTVGPSTSTVLLIADTTSQIGVRLAGSMEVGVAQGNGPHQLSVRLLDPQASLKPNQVLVTYGSQNDVPYVAGIPIGVIQSVESTPGSLTRTAIVRPYVDFTALDAVGVVVKKPTTNPGDTLVPTPTPTASPSKAK
jgi:rod shape-determining protein MreC